MQVLFRFFFFKHGCTFLYSFLPVVLYQQWAFGEKDNSTKRCKGWRGEGGIRLTPIGRFLNGG